MADTLINRAAKERSRNLVRRLGGDIAEARLGIGVSQRALASAAEIDQSMVSRIEAGRVTPSIQTLVALATALGMEANVRLFPTVGPRIHDRVSAPITEALLAGAHPRWAPRLEVFVLKPAKGVIDVVLAETTGSDIVAAEVQGQLRRVEQQLRWAGQKADSLPSAHGWPWGVRLPRVSRLLVLRSTRDTRALVRALPELFRAAYPVAEADAYRALTAASGVWPGNAMLWAEATGRTARILDGAPRGCGR